VWAAARFTSETVNVSYNAFGLPLNAAGS